MKSPPDIDMDDLPIIEEDADQLVAEGIAAMERGDEIDQDDLFAKWRLKYEG